MERLQQHEADPENMEKHLFIIGRKVGIMMMMMTSIVKGRKRKSIIRKINTVLISKKVHVIL